MTEHNAPHRAPTKVVVIGGGYSGTLAANHLRMRGDGNIPDITLVNPRPKFVERIRLHQLVAGNYDATADYGSLLGEGIRLVVDTATRIDTAEPHGASWRPAPRWTTTTSSTRSAAPASSRHRCPARPNSPIPSQNWSRRSVCALLSTTCTRTRR